MKVLKFAPHLADMIIAGEKTTTWRLFDDKDISTGDDFIFVNKESGREFASALAVSVKVKTIRTLDADDWVGHEKFKNEEEMYSMYKKYYGDKVQPDTELKVIKFNIQKFL